MTLMALFCPPIAQLPQRLPEYLRSTTEVRYVVPPAYANVWVSDSGVGREKRPELVATALDGKWQVKDKVATLVPRKSEAERLRDSFLSGLESSNLNVEVDSILRRSDLRQLIKRVASNDIAVRLPAYNELLETEIDDDVVAVILRGLVDDSDLHISDSARGELGFVESTTNENCLLRALKTADWVRRATVYSALCDYSSEASHAVLRKAATDEPQPTARRWAIMALLDREPQAQHEQILLGLLEKEKHPLPLAAILGTLIQLGREEFIERFDKLADYPTRSRTLRHQIGWAMELHLNFEEDEDV